MLAETWYNCRISYTWQTTINFNPRDLPLAFDLKPSLITDHLIDATSIFINNTILTTRRSHSTKLLQKHCIFF